MQLMAACRFELMVVADRTRGGMRRRECRGRKRQNPSPKKRDGGPLPVKRPPQTRKLRGLYNMPVELPLSSKARISPEILFVLFDLRISPGFAFLRVQRPQHHLRQHRSKAKPWK